MRRCAGMLLKVMLLRRITRCYSNFTTDFKPCPIFFSLDIDECSAESSPCDKNADCTNSDGSYSCTCKQGFSGDGTTCEGTRGMLLKVMLLRRITRCYSNFTTDFQTMPHLFLLDIDECSAESSPCDKNADCTNSDGSYSCTCKQGFTGDGTICKGKREMLLTIIHYGGLFDITRSFNIKEVDEK